MKPNIIRDHYHFYGHQLEKSYKKLLDEIITIAIKDYKLRSKKISSFETNILSNVYGLKGKRNENY